MTDQGKSQSDLLRDLHKAEKAEDLETKVQEEGRNLVNRLFMFYRTGEVHDLDNEANLRAIEALQKVIEALRDLVQRVGISAVSDSFYINKILLKPDFTTFENFRFLTQLFTKLNISGFLFTDIPTVDEFKSFSDLLRKSSGDSDQPSWIGNATFQSIQVLRARDAEELAGRVVTRDELADPGYLLRIYFKTALAFDEFVQSVQKGEGESLRVLQRLAHDFIDSVGETTLTLLKLTHIHSREKELAFHSTNVMLLAILMGRELGLTRRQIADLGTSALLHDIGRIQVPKEILEKAAQLRPGEWKQIEQANTYSVVQLLKLRSFNESALRRLLVAYEHAFSATQTSKDREPTLFARIVAIARCYDAMVSPKPYRDPLLPHEAFKLMNKQAKEKFDPALLQIFFHLLTEYPPGTLVRLKSGEIGIVNDSGKTRTDPSKPQVLVIYDRTGRKTAPREIKLSEQPSNGIADYLDPSRLGINVIPYILPQQFASSSPDQAAPT